MQIFVRVGHIAAILVFLLFVLFWIREIRKVSTEKLRAGEPVKMFTDYVRSSLSYPAAAEYLLRLTQTQTEDRIFNICADEPTSKYDLGLFAAKTCGADPALVVPALGQDSGVFTETRAKAIVMSNERLKKAVGEDGVIEAFSDEK